MEIYILLTSLRLIYFTTVLEHLYDNVSFYGIWIGDISMA